MLQFMRLKNFRAFRNQPFDFSNINVFIGPNNSGKSSAISAINLIAQSAANARGGAPLVLRGEFDDLGTYIDMVHGNDPRTTLGIDFGIDKYEFCLSYNYRLQRREIELSKYEIFEDGDPLYSFKQKPDSFEIKLRGKNVEDYMLIEKKRRPDFYGLRVFDSNLIYSRHSRQEDIDKRKTLDEIDFAMSRASRSLAVLRNVDSLSPFRSPPERTFLFTGESPRQIGRTGDAAVEIMVSDNFSRGKLKRGIVDKASEFFKKTGMARELKVKALTSRHFELCLVANDGTEHNICDVGFGCSQVLPVIVGVMNTLALRSDHPEGRGSIFIVQEPEIHLHPNAQAELATMFVSSIGKKDQMFIETHSDTFVLRLQTHVAQKDIAADSVRIFFIEDVGGSKRVSALKLDEKGVFSRPFPGGFFPFRQQESLALAKAASKNS